MTDPREPVHTVYVGAHLFHAQLISHWGELALQVLRMYAPDPQALAAALDYACGDDVYARVIDKIRREPVEDLRIDFEDGFGDRSDEAEDSAARAAAAELVGEARRPGGPVSSGIRIKALSGERAARGGRTLELFAQALLERSGGALPPGFTVTLPKVAAVEDVTALVRSLDRLETRLGIAAGSFTLELMVETPRAIVGSDGRCPLPALVAAAGGRCRGVHFGVYDYSAALGIAPVHQALRHPTCDHARHVMQAALAGSGVVLSAGSTNVLPVPPRDNVLRAWRLHFQDVRHSLVNGFYQGWDLHPAQLVTRYAAVYAFFRESVLAAAPGSVLEDPAAARVRRALMRRAVDCGALTRADVDAVGA
jgi:citrate lyase beta subunit